MIVVRGSRAGGAGVRRCLIGAIASLGIGLSSSATAADAPEHLPVEVFAKLSQAKSIQFSPDGQALVFLSALKGRDSLIVRDGEKIYQLPSPEGVELRWASWASDEWLVVSYSFASRRMSTKTTETRLYAVSRTLEESHSLFRPHAQNVARQMGSIAKLSSREIVANEVQIQDRVINMLPGDPDHIMLSIDADRDGQNEVRKVDIPSGTFETIIEGKRGIQNWVTDAGHEVRYGYGLDYYSENFGANASREPRAVYKNPVTGKWVNVQKRAWYTDESFLGVRAFTDDPRFAYTYHRGESGRQEIVRFDMVEGKAVETLYADDTVDVTGLAFRPDGADGVGKPVGAYYATDESGITYFDPKFAAVKSAVDGALPGGGNVIGSALVEQNKFIILHSSDRDPGRYFMLDLNQGQINPLMNKIPAIDPAKMAPVRAVRYNARDGMEIPAYLTFPVGRVPENLPLVVMPHGGPNWRDYKRFHYRVQFLANRGYAVLQPNFRGSTGYGKKFREAGNKQWGGLMQDDITDGVRWLIEQGIADAERVCILGVSYGGYAALMGAVKTPDLYQCAVSINGVSDLPDLYDENNKYVGGRVWKKSMGLDGESAKAVSPKHQSGRIRIPVLLIATKDDRTVSWRQSSAMHKALKGNKLKNELLILDEGGHSLVTEESRLKTLKAIEKFLKKHIGPGD